MKLPCLVRYLNSPTVSKLNQNLSSVYSKCKGSAGISGRSDHNYRKNETLNADPERAIINKEFINKHDNLSEAINERLKEAGIEHPRKDAVKAMEFLLTASPELFPRDAQGRVQGDYQASDWLTKNLNFMQEKYGPNLVAFTLHQDELTPHIHAIVTPITPDNRLCAKALFNPRTLRQLQTEYATATGLTRGVAGRKAKHLDIQKIYAAQQRIRQGITERITVDKPGFVVANPAE